MNASQYGDAVGRLNFARRWSGFGGPAGRTGARGATTVGCDPNHYDVLQGQVLQQGMVVDSGMIGFKAVGMMG